MEEEEEEEEEEEKEEQGKMRSLKMGKSRSTKRRRRRRRRRMRRRSRKKNCLRIRGKRRWARHVGSGTENATEKFSALKQMSAIEASETWVKRRKTRKMRKKRSGGGSRINGKKTMVMRGLDEEKERVNI